LHRKGEAKRAEKYSARRLGGNSTIKSRYELIEKFERVKDEELEAYASGIVRKD